MKKLEDDFKENGGCWVEYKLDDIFISSNGNIDIQQKHINGKGIPVISSGINNLGFIGLSDINAKIFKKNTFTIDMFGNIFFRDFEYKLVTHARVFSLYFRNKDLNYREGLYLATKLFHLKKIFSFSNMATWEKVKNTSIKLPTINNEIAFDFMEAYIRELEEERIRELEEERIRELTTYLKVSGLENYILTKDEEKALHVFIHNKIKYKKFKLNVLFDIKSSKKKFNANTIKFNGTYPYVARGSSNNGIRGYINEDKVFLNEKNTISFGQDTATVYYQEKPYFTGDKIKILKYKHKTLNTNLSCYLITCIKKAFSNFLWGQSSFNENTIKKTEIELPVTDNKKIDYDFIENFIKAQQKLAIKSVIEWKDKIIENTKKIIL